MVGFIMVLQQKQQTSPGIRIDTIKFHWEFEFNEPVWFMCISILRAKKHKCLWQKHPTKHLIDQVQTKIKGNSISGFNSSPTRPPPKKNGRPHVQKKSCRLPLAQVAMLTASVTTNKKYSSHSFGRDFWGVAEILPKKSTKIHDIESLNKTGGKLTPWSFTAYWHIQKQ